MVMALNRSRRSTSQALFLSLACAVFIWGLHYKLLLYSFNGFQHHHSATAKLLSQKERPLAGMESGRLLLHGIAIPEDTRRMSAAIVAFLPNDEIWDHFGFASFLKARDGREIMRRRSLISSGLRGPPSSP